VVVVWCGVWWCGGGVVVVCGGVVVVCGGVVVVVVVVSGDGGVVAVVVVVLVCSGGGGGGVGGSGGGGDGSGGDVVMWCVVSAHTRESEGNEARAYTTTAVECMHYYCHKVHTRDKEPVRVCLVSVPASFIHMERAACHYIRIVAHIALPNTGFPLIHLWWVHSV
jgi:hypothetical protein